MAPVIASVALNNFLLARRPTLARSAGDEHRFLTPPAVPLTVLSRDEWANDPSLAFTSHYTTPGHIPAHQPPFEPLRANRMRRAGWVCFCFCRRAPGPLRGVGLPGPPLGGRGGYIHRPVCARPLTGGPAAPPPLGGLGGCSLVTPRLLAAAGCPHRPRLRLWRLRKLA